MVTRSAQNAGNGISGLQISKIDLRKKDQSADTNTPPEIKKFWPYPSEKNAKIKGCRCTQPLRNGFFKPSQKFSSIGGCVH
jgi:hypothetical protein